MKKLITALLSGLLALGNTMTVCAEEAAIDTDETILESYELNPDTLHVNKLGETDDFLIEGEAVSYKLSDLVRVSIVLDEAAVLDAGYSSENYAQNTAAQNYSTQLKTKQDQITRQIEAVTGGTLDVKWNLTFAVDVISANVKYGDIAKIKAVNGVKDVFLENRYEAQEDEINTSNSSSGMVGAAETWDIGYTGAGMKIAIIDTGIDIDHQSFNEDAFLHSLEENGKTNAALSKSEAEALAKTADLNGNGKYYSAKIPFGYNYVDKNNTDIVHKNDTEGEHGSHVAGIAAANRYIKNGNTYADAAQTVKAVGMAPDAQLFVMKVFGSAGGAYDSDYMAAIEDAMKMGCDSVNLSLGSGSPGFTYDSTYQEVLNKLAEDNKLVASISAGNSGALTDNLNTDLYIDDVYMHTGGNPGTFMNSLCVASADNIGNTGTPLVFNGSQTVYYTESSAPNAPAFTSLAGSYSYVYIDATGSADDYTTVNSAESLKGKIVIINRGSLTFVEKGNNAISCSPKALLIANNQPGSIGGMALDDYTGTFPMAAITLADVNTIKANSVKKTAGSIDYYTGSVTVTSNLEAGIPDGVTREDAIVSDFSSWGVPGSLIMKPEITAPGGNIYSVFGTNKTTSGSIAGGTDQYELMSGTSMAAPHITGLSAVLSEYLDDKNITLDGYTRRAINQSLLMSTATPMKDADGNYISILQQGAGLADVSKAVKATSIIMMDENDTTLTARTGCAKDGKVKAELGDNPGRKSSYKYSFTIYNLNDQDDVYTLDTDLFTQAHYTNDGHEFMDYATTDEGIGEWTVSYAWEDMEDAGYDVDKDGITDEEDVQAILDYVVTAAAGDAYEKAFDSNAADVNLDGNVSSEDAYDLISWLEKDHSVAEGVVAANSHRKVTVKITPKDILDDIYTSGLYVEGFTSVKTSATTDEGELIDVEHTIPVLGFYGSWTDPSMFDNNSYVDTLYGTDTVPYSGKTSNYMTVQYSGTSTKFSGNPYMVEDTFPYDKLAVNSSSQIDNIYYNLIRSAGTTGFAVSKIDGIGGDVTEVLSSTVTGNEITGLWYYQSQASWQNTGTKTYSIRKTPASYGLKENDLLRVGFYAVPEYNGMLVSEDMTDADAGLLGAGSFKRVLESNVLGDGAYIGYDFKVDNTAPVINDAVLNGNELTVSASDNINLAYVAVLSLDGNMKYAEKAPGSPEYSIAFDASDAVANAKGYVAVFAGDYAGNETAKAIKVNDNTAVGSNYTLVNTITAGKEYLIVSTKTAGSGYALGHNGATSAKDAVTVKAGNGSVYIDASDVDETSVWTAGTGYTFKNGNYYLGRSNTSLAFSTSSSSWTWDGTNNRLSQKYGNNSYYLRYTNNAFSLSRSTSSIYLFEKQDEGGEIDPYAVTGLDVTPGTLDLYKGNETDLVAKVLPLTASDRTVSWTSSNTSVAEVDESGHVTAKAAGSAAITAAANGDNTIKETVNVSVTSVNKSLNGIVWDENGEVYFSNFNTSGLPSYTKLHSEKAGKELVSAFMYSTSALYAATMDASSAKSVIYSVNRNNYAITEYGTNYVPAFDMAPGASSSTYQAYIGFVYVFGTYIVSGPIEPGDDGEGGTYSGLPYAVLNCSETTGDAYFAGVACKSRSTSGGTYYLLDENGVIWQSTLSYSSSNGFSFTTPTKIVETGIGTSFLYQNLYYDGTYIYWSHYADNVTELIIINPSTKAVYHAGNFGEGVWPVGGIYVDGSVAPASEGDEVMSEELPAELNIVATRDELMTEEVMNRFNAEASNFNAQQPYGSANSIKNYTPSKHECMNTSQLTVSVNNTSSTDNGTEGTETLSFAEKEETHYGLYSVEYDPSVITFLSSHSSSAFSAYHENEKDGVIYFAFADGSGISANSTIGEITFSEPEEMTVVTITTLESEDEESEAKPVDYVIGGDPCIIRSASLSLNGYVEVNFYVTIPGDPEETVIVMSNNGKDEIRVNASKGEVSEKDGITRRKFIYPIHVKQLNDRITITAEDTHGNRKKLQSGSGVEFPNGFEYAAADYISSMRSKESSSEELKNLLTSLERYGQWAQKQFEYKDADLNPESITAVTSSELKGYEAKAEKELEDVKITATLLLRSGTDIHVYYYLPEGTTAADYTFRKDGAVVTAELADASANKYELNVKYIHAKYLGVPHVFEIEKDGKISRVEYSALSYAYSKIYKYENGTESETLANTVKAMYLYYLDAQTYFSKNQ